MFYYPIAPARTLLAALNNPQTAKIAKTALLKELRFAYPMMYRVYKDNN